MNILNLTPIFQHAGKQSKWFCAKRYLFFNYKKTFDRNTIAWLQQPIDLRPVAIKNWLKNLQRKALLEDHKFRTDRHEMLGPDLATAHFVVMRGGAVKFEGYHKWFMTDKDGSHQLPSQGQMHLRLEAIDISGTDMMYESFDNFVNLDSIRYLKACRCHLLDDWCLDRFVQFRQSLEVLDLSGCHQITENGLTALHRLHKLKLLRLHDMRNVRYAPLVAVMLEESLPNCVVDGLHSEEMTSQTHSRQSFIRSWEERALNNEREKEAIVNSDGVMRYTSEKYHGKVT